MNLSHMNWRPVLEVQPADHTTVWVFCKNTYSLFRAIYKNGKWYHADVLHDRVLEVGYWINEDEFTKILPS